MNSPPPDRSELSPAQAEIMEIIWERGEATVADIRAALGSDRPITRTTIRTLIERMEAKGWVNHRAKGRTFYYSAAAPRQERIGEKVREVVDTLCGGSAEALVAALIDYRGLDADELDRIRKLLRQARATREKEGRS